MRGGEILYSPMIRSQSSSVFMSLDSELHKCFPPLVGQHGHSNLELVISFPPSQLGSNNT